MSAARRRPGGWAETARTIFYALLIALVVRTFAFEPFNIPSGSMVPTLLVGDYMFVSKYAYGYSRHSLPWGLPLFDGRVWAGDGPERGDVVVFKQPGNEKTDFVKRIIGLPGDTIQVTSGILTINGQPVERQRIEDYVTARGGISRSVPQYIETLPNGRSHPILESRGDDGFYDNTQEYVVPPAHYFAMGDNRDNSDDSRNLSAVGFIPADNLVGRAEILFFSSDGSARLWQVWRWPVAIRFSLLFDAIS
ncbi:MAG: signal peptidase I [Alphaproteobacteria bacterium]